MKFSHFLLLALGVSTAQFSFSQKVKKEDISITYLRLPLEKIVNNPKTYAVEVEIPWVEKEKQKQEDYIADLARAEEEYKEALKAYEEKSTGKKVLEKVALGEGKPKKRLVVKPAEFPTIQPQTVAQQIQLDGYQREENGLKVKLFFEDVIVSAPKDESFTKSEKTYYKRHVDVKQQINYSVYDANGTEIYTNFVVSSSSKGAVTGSDNNSTNFSPLNHGKGIYSKDIASSGFNKYVKKEWDAVFSNKFRTHINELIALAIEDINYHVGFTNTTINKPVFYGHGKKHDYTELVTAMRNAESAYAEILSNFDGFKANVQKSIDVWESAIKEADYENKKAKINAQIAQALMVNKILALTFMQEYDAATKMCNDIEILKDNKGKYRRASDRLREFIKEQKTRTENNA